MVNGNRTNCSRKFDDAIRSYQAGYKTLIGALPYHLMYGKVCHFSVELKHKALWATKKLNFEWHDAVKLRLRKIKDLDEFRLQAYKSSALYKKTMKLHHDQKIERSI
ncbi:uncharacterized protein LOC107844336 [Capsicum annuum]|uniref:uncharacterized protein LOC107844336 n=1 Tax=Capsicum annuum TaxID=4072 RepID=UPI001FB19DA5|nr:uncharacterized protein LOC107844336 [Capsicum annuum]